MALVFSVTKAGASAENRGERGAVGSAGSKEGGSQGCGRSGMATLPQHGLPLRPAPHHSPALQGCFPGPGSAFPARRHRAQRRRFPRGRGPGSLVCLVARVFRVLPEKPRPRARPSGCSGLSSRTRAGRTRLPCVAGGPRRSPLVHAVVPFSRSFPAERTRQLAGWQAADRECEGSFLDRSVPRAECLCGRGCQSPVGAFSISECASSSFVLLFQNCFGPRGPCISVGVLGPVVSAAGLSPEPRPHWG